MNEQIIMAMLMSNPEFRKNVEGLLIQLKDAERKHEEGDMFVWCAEMHDVNTGVAYYHPIVIPGDMNAVMDIDAMMQPSAYKMAAYRNQFEAYRMEGMINALNAYRVRTMLISVNKDVYNAMQTQLTALVTQVLCEIEKCFEPLERVASLVNIQNNKMMKLQLLGNVLARITTTSYCFDENMVIHNSDNHTYDLNEPGCYEEDDEEDEEDEEYYF